MPTPTYTALATSTLTGTASSFTFSAIPGTYRDLVLIAVPPFVGSATNRGSVLRVNGISTSDYSNVRTDNATSAASTDTSLPLIGESTSAAIFHKIDFMDYSATDKHKTLLIRTGQDGTRVSMIVGRVATTSAITSITLFPPDNFISPGTPDLWAIGSTFSLYGVIA
jgi:hypothetical protein